MKKKTTYLLLILFVIFLFAAGSCEKENEEPQLPPITQTGKGTFGCLIDGKVWTADPILFGSPLGASNNQWEDKRWIIDAVGNNYTVILGVCQDSVIKGESILKGSYESVEDCSNGMIYYKNYPSETASFQTTYEDTGRIYISRFDTVNQVISGTFYFNAVNSTGEKVEIRDGRFDVKFINYEP